MNKNVKIAKQLIKLAKQLVAGHGAGINFTLNNDTEGSIKFVAKLQNNKFKCSDISIDNFRFGTFNAIDNEGYGQSNVPFSLVFKLNEMPVDFKEVEKILNENFDYIFDGIVEQEMYISRRDEEGDYEIVSEEVKEKLSKEGLKLGLKCIPYDKANGQFSWGWTREYVKSGDVMPNFGCEFAIYDIDYEKKYGNGILDLEEIPAVNMNITFTDSGAKWYNSLFVDMDYYDDDDDDFEQDDQLSDYQKNNMF